MPRVGGRCCELGSAVHARVRPHRWVTDTHDKAACRIAAGRSRPRGRFGPARGVDRREPVDSVDEPQVGPPVSVTGAVWCPGSLRRLGCPARRDSAVGRTGTPALPRHGGPGQPSDSVSAAGWRPWSACASSSSSQDGPPPGNSPPPCSAPWHTQAAVALRAVARRLPGVRLVAGGTGTPDARHAVLQDTPGGGSGNRKPHSDVTRPKALRRARQRAGWNVSGMPSGPRDSMPLRPRKSSGSLPRRRSRRQLSERPAGEGRRLTSTKWRALSGHSGPGTEGRCRSGQRMNCSTYEAPSPTRS